MILAIEVFFRRHDKNSQGYVTNHRGDMAWSRKEQRGARKELTKVSIYGLIIFVFETGKIKIIFF